MHLVNSQVSRFPYDKESSVMLSFEVKTTPTNEVPSFEEQLHFVENILQNPVQEASRRKYSVQVNTIQGWPPHFVLKKLDGQKFTDTEVTEAGIFFQEKLPPGRAVVA